MLALDLDASRCASERNSLSLSVLLRSSVNRRGEEFDRVMRLM